MDIQKLETELLELQRRYREWVAPIVEVESKTWKKRNQLADYTEADQQREIKTIYQQQLRIYNPPLAEFPVREALLTNFVTATEEERYEVHRIMNQIKYASWMMFEYIHKCAECIETPEDAWILRSGLIAAAIEDYGWGDFRDTQYALSDLAVAARDASIDIEPHARIVADLCVPSRPNYFAIRTIIENFHIFALTAEYHI